MDELENCRSLVDSLLAERSSREPAWRELSRWLIGYRGVFDQAMDDYDTEDLKLFRAAASQGCLRSASGMTSGMTPRNVSWFKPCFTENALMELSGARSWLDMLDMRMKDILSAGGFYQAIQNFNLDLIWAGCALLYSERGNDGILKFECCQIGTFCVALDCHGQLQCVARQTRMSVSDMAKAFGEDKLLPATRQKLKDKPHSRQSVWHLVRSKPYGRFAVSSSYWEPGAKNFLRQSGYYEMPYFFTCWHEGATAYGTGPGDECLADARQMDTLERNKLAGLGMLVNPPVMAAAHLKDTLDLTPGGINYVANKDQIVPIIDMGPYAAAMSALQNEIATVEQRLHTGLMANVFEAMPLEQRPRDMSATEYLERKREALQLLGPVISAYEPNVLTPLLYRVAQSLSRSGQLPPVPSSLEGVPLLMKIDFISPMANALRQTGAEAARSLLQDVASIYQITQQADIFDKIDLDQAVDELANGIGAPGSIVRSDDDVAQIRQSRAQQQQQTQQIQLAQESLNLTQQAQQIAANQQSLQQIQE